MSFEIVSFFRSRFLRILLTHVICCQYFSSTFFLAVILSQSHGELLFAYYLIYPLLSFLAENTQMLTWKAFRLCLLSGCFLFLGFFHPHGQVDQTQSFQLV